MAKVKTNVMTVRLPVEVINRLGDLARQAGDHRSTYTKKLIIKRLEEMRRHETTPTAAAD